MNSFPNDDLVYEILLRLPAKSVARCSCVSKLRRSILSRQDFTELFLTKSSARPRLLFGVKRANGEGLFFSSTQPRNSYEKSSLVVAADFHTKFSEVISREICSYASGLIYLSDMRISVNDEDVVRAICNPITGNYLGFDPIDKQFKVLFMAYPSGPDDHKILTLGTRRMRWRKIHCPLTHDPFCEGICINGVLYYLAIQIDEPLVNQRSFVIVCFDVRFEKFTFIDVDCFYHLINYKGKLGGIDWKHGNANGSRTFELSMWVLEDVEKHEWSKYDCTFLEYEVMFYNISLAVGMTATCEIVLSEKFASKSFYVFYFNPERETLQRVEIQGLENHCRVYTITDHVEDLNVNYKRKHKMALVRRFLAAKKIIGGSVAKLRKETSAILYLNRYWSYPASTTLINYKGKVGVINLTHAYERVFPLQLRMTVLEDFEKQEWSTYVYTLMAENIVVKYVSVVGMTATGDIVLVKTNACKPFYVFYFNPGRNTLLSVEIQGVGEDHKCLNFHTVCAFVDHVEDLQFSFKN
ncbi:F-box/associated interaction domain protein [Arabidopsis thaliana]|uniref:Putative F-box protein At1g30925 n=1 Tax=Arabidopsis thaliana TaxID=3702 RepID=FB308_ARATH|nr:F-box/associated interaction domain protein [Arabidopsis thaliana]P0C2G3.3 RecName: Full=Putative F-box protein At1g30925 [Arabidopsis thaliana]AEE31294.2 F-box/associated interaction domain protein [Arabidopsis thaliana]|eukprot:NP_001319119.1 F-box/associated interaction domain protein [Arabidopsis thaliana]